MKKIASYIAIVLLLLASAQSLAQDSAAAKKAAEIAKSALFAQVDAMAAADYEKNKIGGLTVGIVSGADLVWTKSYGYADMEKRIPTTKDSVYRIGSITKQFTALMLLQLVERGKVHLFDPAETYYPELAQVQGRFPGVPTPTLLQLATHTSGLAREPKDESSKYFTGPVKEWESRLLLALPETKYENEPGLRFSYSNMGYAILGAALGRAAGEPYVSYVSREILAPLGMEHTAFELNEKIRADLAKGYHDSDWRMPLEQHKGRGYKVPNGALYSTVGDMARFLSFEMEHGPNGVLKKTSLYLNFMQVYSATGDLAHGYGIGFEARRRGSLVAYGHGGAVVGYPAAAYFNRESGKGVIVLANASGAGGIDVVYLAMRILEKVVDESIGVAKN